METSLLTTVPAALLALASLASAAPQNLGWTERYDGADHDDDYARACAVDSAGNLVVVGATREFLPPNVTSPRFLTHKLDPQGNRLWSNTFHQGFGSAASFAYAVAFGAGDEVYVAGSVDGADDWALIKYSATGVELWNRVYAANSSYLSNPEVVVIDAAGNAYMTGDVGSGASTATTVKYDVNGVFQWDRPYAGPSSAGSSSTALVVDAAGNVYVAGSTVVAGQGSELSVHKLDSAGNVVWLRTFGYPGSSTHDRAQDIALTPAGNLVAAGYYGWNTAQGSDLAVVSLDTAGNLLWERTFDGTSGRTDVGVDLEVDALGRVFVGGYSSTAPNDYDALLVKYDAGGTLQWARTYAGAALMDDYAQAIAADGTGAVMMVGVTVPLNGSENYFTARYSAAGILEWDDRYAGTLNGASRAVDVAIGRGASAGAIFVTGESDDSSTKQDVVTLRYDGAGPPEIYCTAQVNTQGCTPAIGFSGTPSASAGSGFTIDVTALINNKSGILFYGRSGPNQAPFRGGLLCVTAPLKRTGLRDSGGNPPPDDCSGAISMDFNTWIAGGKDSSLLPGVRVWCQYWSRDPTSFFRTNLSDALTFLIGG